MSSGQYGMTAPPKAVMIALKSRIALPTSFEESLPFRDGNMSLQTTQQAFDRPVWQACPVLRILRFAYAKKRSVSVS